MRPTSFEIGLSILDCQFFDLMNMGYKGLEKKIRK